MCVCVVCAPRAAGETEIFKSAVGCSFPVRSSQEPGTERERERERSVVFDWDRQEERERERERVVFESDREEERERGERETAIPG